MTDIEAIKARVDIVDLIGERVKLTRSGKNFKGLCPFHGEKSPSFFVTPELGRYKCFGCQESGDIFTFLEKTEGLSFAEALQVLAKRSGITLTNIPFTPEDTKKQRILEVLSLAKEFYHFLLTKHAVGKDALAYLKDRGTQDSTVELFGIGVAPASWDSLGKYLIGKKGYTQEELLDAGLAVQSERGMTYDRFRDRLMFPLTDSRGQVVGFSGRLMDKNAKEAKYINTPETLVYHKSELLFGFSQMKAQIRKANEIVIVEGEFDALSSIQAHVSNTVAIKGSAFTKAHAALLKHTVKRVLFALDSDAAGVEATKRAISVAADLDISLRVIPLVGGKDPDDIARLDPATWRSMVKQSVSVYEFLIDVSFKGNDATTGEGKRSITNELVPLLAKISNGVEQAHYVVQVSKRLGVREEVLLSELKKTTRPQLRVKTHEKIQTGKSKTREEVLVSYVISLLFGSDRSVFAKRREQVANLDLPSPYDRLVERAKAVEHAFDIATFAQSLPSELTSVLSEAYMQATDSDAIDSNKEFEKTIEEIADLTHKRRRLNAAQTLAALMQKEELTQVERMEIARLQGILAS